MNAPIDPRARFVAAIEALRRGDSEQASALIEPLLETGASSPDLQHLAALVRAAQDNDEAAERHFRAALRLNPNFAVSIQQFTRFLLARGRVDEALALISDATARIADPGLFDQLAAVLNALGRGDEAEAALRQAVRLAPSSAAPIHNLAAYLGQVERYAEAEATARRAIALNRAEPASHHVLARALVGLERYNEAEAALVEALRHDPLYAPSHKQLAELIWMMTGDVGRASERLIAAENGGENFQITIHRAQLLDYAGQADEAYRALASALHHHPDQPQLLTAAAKQAMKLGEVGTAVAHAERAMLAAPGDLDARFVLCEILLGAGDAVSSEKISASLMADLPNDQNAASLRATAWRILGDSRYGELYDYAAMVRTYVIDTPSGWPDLKTYLAELAGGLARHHAMTTHPVGQSLRNGTQTLPSLLTCDDPAIKAFPSAIDGPIRRYLSEIGEGDDLLRRRKTGSYRIGGIWSVRLKPNGFHADHVHPMGWISSACYIELPSVIDAGGREGWLKFGEPGVPTDPRLPAEHYVKPEPGLLALFPSYMWHGTEPFSGDRTRLTIAFDLVPRAS